MHCSYVLRRYVMMPLLVELYASLSKKFVVALLSLSLFVVGALSVNENHVSWTETSFGRVGDWERVINLVVVASSSNAWTASSEFHTGLTSSWAEISRSPLKALSVSSAFLSE